VAKPFVVRIDARATPRIGDVISVALRPGAEHLFDPGSGARIN
jgi:hypothetical protein